MSVESNTLPPVPQHIPPLVERIIRGKPIHTFDVSWMQWFVQVRLKVNVINGPVLLPSAGGTGISSYTIGDILYASGTDTLAPLNAGASGYVLTSNGPGTPPSYQESSSSASVSLGLVAQIPYMQFTL